MAFKKINTSNGGVFKPVAKTTGIIWWAPADSADVSTITATSDLSEAFKNAGAIHADGVTGSTDTNEGDSLFDWNGNTFASTESTSTFSLNFKLLELFREEAASLVYLDSAVKTDGSGNVTEISGDANPSNKFLVIDMILGGKAYRVIYPNCAFSSRGDMNYANDALANWEVTYKALTGKAGISQKIIFGTAA